MGSTLSSPLESPDILQRFWPISDIDPATTSMASIKLSADSINTNTKYQQVRLQNFQSNMYSNYANYANYSKSGMATTSFIETEPTLQNSMAVLDSVSSLQSDCTLNSLSIEAQNAKLNTIFEHPTSAGKIPVPQTPIPANRNPRNVRTNSKDRATTLLEFSLSSVGRSFIDESIGNVVQRVHISDSLKTPDTPEPNISPSSSSMASKSCFSETFSNDFMKPSTPSVIVSPLEEHAHKYAQSTTTTNTTNGGSWDLLELDLDFHHVNFDPSFGGDVEENVFYGDDPLGILPIKPTEPDSHDL